MGGAARGHTPVDVKIIANDPRITPWSKFQSAFFQDDRIPSSYCFPDTEEMQSSRHKAVWRGLESTNGWSFNLFFKMLASQWKHVGAPASLEDLQRILDCNVSHNLAGNMMYIVSKNDQRPVETAVQKLDNFLEISLRPPKLIHLIVPEGPGPFRLSYKWLSHVGQNQSTYIVESSGTVDEHRRLPRAVTLRAERQDENGQWISSRPRERPKTGLKPGVAKVFDPFNGYEYAKKSHNAVHELFKAIAKAQGTRQQDSNRSKMAVFNSETNPKKLQALPLHPERAPLQLSPHTVHNHDHLLHGADDNLCGSLVEPSPKLLEASQTCLSRNDVSSWRDDVERAQTDLLSFDEFPQDSPAFETQSLAAAVGGLEPGRDDHGCPKTGTPFDFESDDLICLGEVSHFEGLVQSSMEAPHGHLLDLAAPMEQEPQQLVNASSLRRGTENAIQTLLDEAIPDIPSFQIPHDAVGATMKAVAESDKVGTDSRSRRETGKGHLLKMIDNELENVARILPLVPGIISMEVKFGRFYRKNLSHSLVDVGSGPYWTMGDIVQSLNDADLQKGNMGFSTALTTCGVDMDELIQSHATGEDVWILDKRQDWYEIFCTAEGNETFVVELDATTFDYRCRSEEKEVGGLLLHCVHRPWDMQVCISHSMTLQESRVHMAIAKALVASISVSNSKDREVMLETTTDPSLKAKVDAIMVRHDAQYRLGAGSDSILSIKLTKKLNRGPRLERREQWRTDRTSSTRKGIPREWYEASLLSLRTQQVLKENEAISFGDKASWRCEQLKDQGIFDALCRPALGIISRFDTVGLLNDNGLRIKDEVVVHDTVAEAKERKGVEVFW